MRARIYGVGKIEILHSGHSQKNSLKGQCHKKVFEQRHYMAWGKLKFFTQDPLN